MVFNKPIEFLIWDEDTENWTHYRNAHASINKKGGTEYLSSGAEQSKQTKVFEARYCKQLAEIELDTQSYAIAYNGATYDITDYDDFKEQHKTIKLLGVARGV